ncbi:MAG TPA: vWA domain-containing protein, partial [Polyangia bacterium]
TPTVFILVDRSGSEFDSGCPNVMTGAYFTLKSAVESVVSDLQSQFRFGLGVFVGDHSTGTCARDWDTVPIDLNNSDAIKSKYDSLGQVPMASGGNCKADTPAVEAIPMVKSLLQADTAVVSGPKFMLFATDGQTDFCDDGDPDCPADAITGEVQDLYTAGFGTLIMGDPFNGAPSLAFNATVLQNLANAGTGQGTTLPTQNGSTMQSQVYYACNGQGTAAGANSWTSLYTAAGHAASDTTTIATYSTAGTAKVFSPGGSDMGSLVTQLKAAINSVPRSCTFDLSTLAHPIKVDRTKLSEGGVFLNGAPVQLDPNNMNGWDMISDTQLELFGDPCTTFQDPSQAAKISLDFPCDLIIIVDKP